jgi:hypothetical protein
VGREELIAHGIQALNACCADDEVGCLRFSRMVPLSVAPCCVAHAWRTSPLLVPLS